MHQFNMFSLLLGKRVPVNVKHMIKNALGRQNEGEIGTYIGISENIMVLWHIPTFHPIS